MCGAIVAPDEARAEGLAARFEDDEFVFCGLTCHEEFIEDPETFLRPAYVAVL